MKKNKFLLVIAGPTAVGKTELCLKLAKNFQTEIISSDSRQFFREMILGTAKPSGSELAAVPHHFIDSLSIQDAYDVKQFEQDALLLLDRLFAKHDVVLLTGGSGLYIDAVCNGFDDIPVVDSSIREELITAYRQNGLVFLQEELKQVDPVYYGSVDLQNPQRLIRALEVYRGTGKAFSTFRVKQKAIRPFRIIKIGLERDREELYRRIDGRMDQMIEKGLFEEAAQLFPKRKLNALQTVGYTEIFGFLEGKYDRVEAVRLLKRNSRRYAKRQMTWFRRDASYSWFHPDQVEEITDFVARQISL